MKSLESTAEGGGEEREASVPAGKPQHSISGVLPVKHGRQTHSEKESGGREESKVFFMLIDGLQ